MATLRFAPPHQHTPGWYGKLSSLGDFAQRRLPQHWLDTCDPWLSAAMQAGNAVLRDRWLQAYLTAPVLRYAWAPGVIDDLWWFGLLMPSCDNVGRYFPLLITQARARPPEDRIGLDHLELWYDHLGRAAMQTLGDERASIDHLEAALHEAPPWPSPNRGGAWPVHSSEGSEHWHGNRQLPLTNWLHTMAVGQLARQLQGHSLWWRSGGNAQDAADGDTMDVVRGLPQGRQFVALIDPTVGG